MDQPRPKPIFAPAGFFVLRTPLLPFDEFLSWGEGLEAVSALNDPLLFELAYAQDCSRLRERLKSVVTRPEVRDALFIASSNIIERFHSWTDDPESERGRKVENVLVRYFSRMSGRATPFGLFAGVSVGAIGDQTNLAVTGSATYQRHTRLNMDYLDALVDTITCDASLRSNLTFRPNNSLYRVADRVHYVESRLAEKSRSYHLVAVAETEYLAATIERAASGATPEALAAALADDEVSLDVAREYIDQLIDAQILVADIELNVSGPPAVEPLIDQLGAGEKTSAIAHALHNACSALASIDRAGLGIDIESYRHVARCLEGLPAKVELSRLFQVDLVKPAPAATLGAAVLEEITRGVEILHRLSPRRDENELTSFREDFVRRYEEREVPLVEALDDEIGIGFGSTELSSPLLQDLEFPAGRNDTTIDRKRQAFLLRTLCDALANGAREINLDEVEIEQLAPGKPDPLPASFALEVTVAARTPAACDDGDFRLAIGNGCGPSAAIVMGRFCHADEDLKQKVLTLLQQEEAQQPDAVFAEIVHLPEGKLGAIAARSRLRAYEIPFLARSVVDSDHQIPITDLYVSVRDNRIRLRSARLDREVVPRMSNAHNYSWRSPGVYRFLCLLQQQDTARLFEWDWGTLATAPFLPRVCSGRLVLAPARWHVPQEELKSLGKEKGPARFRAVQAWRKKRELPRLIALADGDNLLPVDLENILSVDSFVQLIRERETATVLEVFPASDELCASGPEGSFVHELMVPFISTQPAVAERPLIPSTSSLMTRRFPPGSDWLYVKLYTGPAIADRLLQELVTPFVRRLKDEGAVNRWFFVRYSDPDFHLRLRFHGEPDYLRNRLQPWFSELLTPFVTDNRIWRIEFDTYEREVERYGGPVGLTLAEELFQIDSEAVLELVEMVEPSDEGADERWRLALFGIDRLLEDFAVEVGDKYSILKEMRDAFAAEFMVDQNLRSQLSDRFRKERHALQELLETGPDSDHPLAPGLACLHERSRKLCGVVSEIKSAEQEGRLSLPWRRLLPHYLHMFCNRLLRTAHREQELVIYDLLTKHYESRVKFGVQALACETQAKFEVHALAETRNLKVELQTLRQ